MRRISVTAGSLAWLLLAGAALAVRPQAWSFSNEKDFTQGTFDNTVVDSYGQLSLGRRLAPVQTASDAEIIAGFAQTADGALYVAMGPEPRIYRIEGDKGTLVYTAPRGFSDITTLAADAQGNLLVGLSGKKARLVEIKPGEKGPGTTRFESDDTDYIWTIVRDPQGNTYFGTGPNGKVYRLGEPGKESPVVLDSTAKNVLSLAFDKAGDLIAGTDSKGLVIRVDSNALKTPAAAGPAAKPFVLLDAGKVDVNAIVPGTDGSLYVATAKADLADDQNSPDTDDLEGAPTKSKPGTVEPEPVEPPADNGKAGALAPMWKLPADRGVLGANEPGLPPELKALLNKVAQDRGKDGPASQKKPPLPTRPARRSNPRRPQDRTSEGPPEQDTSALYRISPDGAVTTLLRESDTNYALLLIGDDLLVGTGNEGKLFRYRLTDQSLTLMARVNQEHITALLADKTGDILVGTANMAQVYRLGPGLAKSGTFTSQVLDAGHTADWGRAVAQCLPALSPGMKATLATRTSNTRHLTGGSQKFWSPWSDEMTAGIDGRQITSPAARYLQFRVTLTADDKGSAPVVSTLRVAYQTENLPPRIESVTVDNASSSDAEDSDEGADSTDRWEDAQPPSKTLHISWEASDPNADTLVYRVLYRVADGNTDASDDVWTPLAHDLKFSSYDWDTRAVPDGRYQVKIIASDKLDNPAGDAKETARVTPPLTIDHTPPVMADLKGDVEGNKAHVAGSAKDALSPVVDVRYQLDGQGDWQPAAPSDKLFNSLEEAFTIVTAPLSTGGHRITVRATDAHGNNSYKAITLVVKP